jgi:hypothetical protein
MHANGHAPIDRECFDGRLDLRGELARFHGVVG